MTNSSMITDEKNDTLYISSDTLNPLIYQLYAAIKASEIARVCACKKRNE
jgi:hypothetical protein